MAREIVEGPGGTQATHNAKARDFGDISEDLGTETRQTGVQSELGVEGAAGARARLQARASRAVEVSSDYLREHDIDEMRTDLEREIRAHPIKSIAIALGAGYVLGRIFR
jgi:ElaB/YqjD/DUF883 family membrane-anchored ribosome-binding protein